MSANLKRFASLSGVVFLAVAGFSPKVCAQQPCIPPPSGLVSWWTGDSNTSDLLGSNNPSASNAVTFVPGEVGRGFTFGPGGYIDIPASPSLANQRFTLSAWVRPDGSGPNNDFEGSWIVGQDIDNTHATQLSWDAADDRFVFLFGQQISEMLTSQDAFPPGHFYLVTGTYDGSTFILYVNGQVEGTFSLAKTITYSAITWTIGSSSANIRGQGFPRTWNGVIDEVQVFNRALSAAEIQAIYNAVSAGECKPAGGCGASSSEFAYVTNALSNSISVYRVDGNTGALTPTSVTADSSEPEPVAIDPLGRFAYVGNSAATGGTPSISVYTIDLNTGALTEVSGSPFPTGFLGPGPNGIAVHPTGNFLYLANDQPAGNSHVSAFSVDSHTGALTQIPGSPYQTGINTWSVTTDPAGKFLFVADGSSCDVLAYSIDAATGALTPVPGSPFHSGCDALIDVVDPTGPFLYVSNETDNTISGYKIGSSAEFVGKR